MKAVRDDDRLAGGLLLGLLLIGLWWAGVFDWTGNMTFPDLQLKDVK
jgi:hypothetical protein